MALLFAASERTPPKIVRIPGSLEADRRSCGSVRHKIDSGMMVNPEFPGDNNHVVMDIQHSMYNEIVVRLFTGPRDRYLAAATLLRVEDELSQALRDMNGFDHRTLQLAHDRMAAWFRFAHDDGGQLQLGESELDYSKRMEALWRDFACSEVTSLARDDEFTRAICTAAAFGNRSRGVAAERWIGQFLSDRYGVRGLQFKE
ncbi:MAG: hypothetical protein J0H49_11515 [Acidobacteria bacterium]|nr:hypothetical protein [Acidobacteriota bacterium]